LANPYDRTFYIFKGSRVTDRPTVAEPHGAVRVDEKFLDDSDISCDALRAETHRQPVDMGL
jgi:hypothetical protein